MKHLISELAELALRHTPGEGLHPTSVPGIQFIRVSKINRRTNQKWGASFCIIFSGTKKIILNQRNYRLAPGDFIATPIDFPIESFVSAGSVEAPFLSLKIDLDAALLGEIASQLPMPITNAETELLPAMFTGKTNERILETALRLKNLVPSRDDGRVLGPLLIKEILYHVLSSEEGRELCLFVRSGSRMHKVSQAIYQIKNSLDRDFDINELVEKSNMSRSAFFSSFKNATSMSPIQYQKRLRLLEARRLMVEVGDSVEISAFKVGYKSASQFSREYSRMFGNSPLRDVGQIRKKQQPTISGD